MWVDERHGRRALSVLEQRQPAWSLAGEAARPPSGPPRRPGRSGVIAVAVLVAVVIALVAVSGPALAEDPTTTTTVSTTTTTLAAGPVTAESFEALHVDVVYGLALLVLLAAVWVFSQVGAGVGR